MILMADNSESNPPAKLQEEPSLARLQSSPVIHASRESLARLAIILHCVNDVC
jgi:hypothetical protein